MKRTVNQKRLHDYLPSSSERTSGEVEPDNLGCAAHLCHGPTQGLGFVHGRITLRVQLSTTYLNGLCALRLSLIQTTKTPGPETDAHEGETTR